MTEPVNPNDALRERVAASLARQGMMQHLGVRLLAVGPGTVTLALPTAPFTASVPACTLLRL